MVTSNEEVRDTLELGPGETKSITKTLMDFIEAIGVTKKAITIKFIDTSSGKVIRSESISAGAHFHLRNNFSGTKTVRTEITNKAMEQNIVHLTIQ